RRRVVALRRCRDPVDLRRERAGVAGQRGDRDERRRVVFGVALALITRAGGERLTDAAAPVLRIADEAQTTGRVREGALTEAPALRLSAVPAIVVVVT